MRGPTAIYRQRYAGDRSRGLACKKNGKRAQLFDRGETFVRLLRKQNVADDLVARNTMGLGLRANFSPCCSLYFLNRD